MFTDEDITGPNCRGLMFPNGDIAGPDQQHELAPAAFNPSLEYSTDNVVLFWQPPSYFSQWSPSSFVVDRLSYSCAEQFMMAETARLLNDHRAVELIMLSPDPNQVCQTVYMHSNPRKNRVIPCHL